MATTLDRPTEAVPDGGSVPVTATRALRVVRTPRGDGPRRWQRVDVPVTSPRMTVLDALTWIRSRVDPTLDVRHSCFHASCGTCGMRVDGRDVLACVTRLDDLPDGEVVVEPLRNQPVVSDLVVDIEALYEALEPMAVPLVRSSTLVAGGRPAEGVEALGRFEDCIECGLCISACPIEATDAAYEGPAVLGAAWRVIEEPRGADPGPAYEMVDGDQGAWRCHLAFECSEACPSEAGPGERILHLRRGLLRRRVAAILGRRATSEGSGR
ncbi:MAG TPA: 2Fe-2S iron-sulfur cluster-binding protein [Candidatus Limnocylindrales bacterium]|nr:2Fe-2S iron-sulfur cluster-binding protein [Candidatus Limnocylindrales bacterium]